MYIRISLFNAMGKVLFYELLEIYIIIIMFSDIRLETMFKQQAHVMCCENIMK